MIYDPKTGAAFLHIPKTGGSSVTAAMADATGNGSDLRHHGWQVVHHNIGLTHSFWSDIAECVSATARPFTVVRNPYTRTLSHYQSLRWRRTPLHRNASEEVARAAKELSLVDWLDFMHGHDNPAIHKMVAPQTAYLEGSPALLLLHTENLDTEFAAMCEDQGWPYRLRSRENEGPAPASASPLLGPDAAGAVLKHYASDFRALGYDTDPAKMRDLPG